ncbi:hypothetical protein CRUP_004143 [Coryphaenoides rupestris]|nr:hypothetical protein CRUP_004143 [Coryphaenoides rupestris]
MHDEEGGGGEETMREDENFQMTASQNYCVTTGRSRWISTPSALNTAQPSDSGSCLSSSSSTTWL